MPEKPASFHLKILNLAKQNFASALTGYNDVEILQAATMKYPRLPADPASLEYSRTCWLITNKPSSFIRG